MRHHIIGTGIVFLVILIEDFIVGSLGHYTGSGSDANFIEYVLTIPPEHFLVILVASIIIYLILTRSPLRTVIK